MDDPKQTKITNYFPKPKPAPYTSIVENYYLTSPSFREGIYTSTITPHAPWAFVEQVASYGTGSLSVQKDEPPRIKDTVTELLKKKFDAGKVDKAIEKAFSVVEPYIPQGDELGTRRRKIYRTLAYAEKLLVNPGWEGRYINETPPIPVTLEDKHLAGTYTDADTYYLKRLKSGDMMDRMVAAHGLEGLFGGIHRRKTKKSKRAQKKRKSTRKSKLTRSR